MRTRLKKVTPYWAPTFVTLLLVVDLIYVQLQKLAITQDRIDYALVLFYQKTRLDFPLVAFVGFCIAIVYFLSVKWRVSRSRYILYTLSSIVLIFVALPLSGWPYLAMVIEDKHLYFAHVDRIWFDNELYQLAYMERSSYGEASYNLYRCDSLGFICDRVKQVDTSLGSPYQNAMDSEESALIATGITPNSLTIVAAHMRLGDYTPEQKPPA